MSNELQKSQQELSDTTKELTNLEMMEKIASNSQTLDDIRNLTSSKVTDQLKVFLVSQARNELSRVIKLTKFLDKIENNFMIKVTDAITEDELTLKQYGEIIQTITDLLNRSNTIISTVLRDDSLMTILNTTIYATDNELTTTSVVSTLKDAQSRERVRVVLNQILTKTKDYVPDDNLVEVEENGDDIDE